MTDLFAASMTIILFYYKPLLSSFSTLLYEMKNIDSHTFE